MGAFSQRNQIPRATRPTARSLRPRRPRSLDGPNQVPRLGLQAHPRPPVQNDYTTALPSLHQHQFAQRWHGSWRYNGLQQPRLPLLHDLDQTDHRTQRRRGSNRSFLPTTYTILSCRHPCSLSSLTIAIPAAQYESDPNPNHTSLRPLQTRIRRSPLLLYIFWHSQSQPYRTLCWRSMDTCFRRCGWGTVQARE